MPVAVGSGDGLGAVEGSEMPELVVAIVPGVPFSPLIIEEESAAVFSVDGPEGRLPVGAHAIATRDIVRAGVPDKKKCDFMVWSILTESS